MLKRLALAFSSVRRVQEERARTREQLLALQAAVDRLVLLEQSIQRQDVVIAYLDLFGHPPENNGVVQYYLARCSTVEDLYNAVRESPEYQAHIAPPPAPEVPAPEAPVPARLKQLKSLAELDEIVKRAEASETEEGRVSMLCEYVFRDPSMTMPSDPFSPEYRDAVLTFYHKVTGRGGYDPAMDELNPFDIDERVRQPSIYSAGSSVFLGRYIEAFGQILQIADARPGSRILEYGPGEGQIALNFARMGCEVTVVDIEPRYLEVIYRQAKALGLTIGMIKGDFLSAVEGTFDRVLFFETFHHSLDHYALLLSLHERLAPGGKVIFAGEPIIPEGDYWADVAPFPWGIRMDTLSLGAIRKYGWMELGFQESYFLELLDRTGWKAQKIVSSSNGMATCYVAERR
jgi:SAM-dependent methyltransferase